MRRKGTEDPGVGGFQAEGGLFPGRDEVVPLPGEAVDRALVGRPMDALIGDGCHPA